MTPSRTYARFLPALLHAMPGILMSACLLAPLLQPTPLRADVSANTGDKPKKDPKDKKRDDKLEYLPEARAASARFVHGHSVEAELVAAVGSLKQMEFVIRQAPKNGTLSAIRPDLREGHKATVTYTHSGGDAPLADSFTYACRLDGGPWSAPATVTLVGARLEPRIEVVNLPQFGRVFLGGESTARMLLRNAGTADFHMDVKWPEPFSGPAAIAVPRGGTAEIDVTARPAKTGDFRHELVLQPGLSDARAVLYVTCLKALSVSPSRLTLHIEEADGERSGVLSLANARDLPVRVFIKHPDRLHAPEETEVAGGSRSDLRISLPAGDVDSFAGEIVVVSGDDVQKVVVEADPKPAVLQVLVPASLALDFGTVDQHTSPSREVVLSNSGGRALFVEARTLPPYSLGASVRSLRIEPRAQVRVKVSLQTARPGSTPGELELESNSSSVIVSLAADIQEAGAPPAPSPGRKPSVASPVASSRANPGVTTFGGPIEPGGEVDRFSARSTLQAALMAHAASKGLPIDPAQINPNLPSIPSIEFISATSSEVVVAWPKPSVIPPGWIIETASQAMDPKTGIFVKYWVRHRDWETLEIDGDRIAVRLRNLSPASLYELRVLAVDREGKLSEPVVTKLVQTALPWRLSPWAWRLIIAAGLAACAFVLYRARHGRLNLAPA